MAHKAWFKVVNPESTWAKVSLEGIQHVYDIKAAIKAEMPRRLNPYDAEHLTLKATKNDKDPSHAVELGEEAGLVSVLEHFGIAGSPSVEQAFANNIRLFVFAPSRPAPPSSPTAPPPPAAGSSAPSPQDVFESFTKSEHGAFLSKYITNNDILSSYEPKDCKYSREGIETPIPNSLVLENWPSLLFYNLPQDPNTVSETATAALKAMEKATQQHMLVMLGTSGCGKTRTCYEVLCKTWGIYFTVGSEIIDAIEQYVISMAADDPKSTYFFHSNRSFAEHGTRCAIVALLLVLRYYLKFSKGFTPQQWLLLQVAQKQFSKLFIVLTRALFHCLRNDIDNLVQALWTELQSLLGFKVFPIILDEAQLLQYRLQDYFKSTTDPNKDRSLLSPIIHVLRQPWPGAAESCAVPCGTGLGLLSLREQLETGIAKPLPGICRFTEFGIWRNKKHVKLYADTIVKLSDKDIGILYDRFRGRFRPIVTCIERIITGSTLQNAVETTWNILTSHQTDRNEEHQSLYNQLIKIENCQHPNYVNSEIILELFKSIALTHFYAGMSTILRHEDQMEIIKFGLGRLEKLSYSMDPPDGIDEIGEESYISDVDLKSNSEAEEVEIVSFKDGLRVVVDEPIVFEALYNYFEDKAAFSSSILDMMANVHDSSAAGTLWQRYLPIDLKRMFDGTKIVSELVIFKEIPPDEIPDVFKQPATIVGPSDSTKPIVKLASKKYTLKDYLDEEPDSRPAFFIPEDLTGPDLIFFIKIHSRQIIPVILQLKLRGKLSRVEAESGISTCDPHKFYHYRDGKKKGQLISPEVNGPVVKKMLHLCEHGVVQILVAYPASISVTPKKPARIQPSRAVKKDKSKPKPEPEVKVAIIDELKHVTTNTKRKYEEHNELKRKRHHTS